MNNPLASSNVVLATPPNAGASDTAAAPRITGAQSTDGPSSAGGLTNRGNSTPQIKLAADGGLDVTLGATSAIRSTTSTVVALPLQTRSEDAAAAQPSDVMAEAHTLLHSDLVIEGDIRGSDALTIQSVVQGNVTINGSGMLQVCEGATVAGNLQADRIKIEGSVTGDINAEHGKVTIEPTSRVNGKVRYKQIALNGGKHKMSLEHVDDGSEARD